MNFFNEDVNQQLIHLIWALAVLCIILVQAKSWGWLTPLTLEQLEVSRFVAQKLGEYAQEVSLLVLVFGSLDYFTEGYKKTFPGVSPEQMPGVFAGLSAIVLIASLPLQWYGHGLKK